MPVGCGTPSLDSALILRRELGDEGDPGPEQALPDGRMRLRAASGGRESPWLAVGRRSGTWSAEEL